MMWRRNKKDTAELSNKQKAAEDAVRMSQVGLMDAMNLDSAAERVQRGHRRIQVENHLGEKMFGVKKPA